MPKLDLTPMITDRKQLIHKAEAICYDVREECYHDNNGISHNLNIPRCFVAGQEAALLAALDLEHVLEEHKRMSDI